MSKKKKTSTIIDIKDTLLKKRQVFLFGTIKEKNSNELIKEIITLNYLNTKPITLTINSPGGSVPAGLAIIDVITTISSPVDTVIIGEACSMASIISIIGRKRKITKNAVWMAHPMSTGYHDYIEHIKDFIKSADTLENIITNIYKEHTKLTKKDYDKMARGQLWLNAKECLKKGIVDKIV